MTDDRNIRIYEIEWEGIPITITYEKDWLSMGASEFATSHIEIQSADGQPLPITETGYLSHFFEPRDIDPVAEIKEWLALRAQSKEWQKYLAETQQLNLF